MKNLWLITLFNFCWMFIPVISIFVPFTSQMGISMKDFFLLQSFFNLIVILIEVPSGYVADLLGRKKSIVIGSFLGAIGFSILPFSKELWHLYIYEAFVALSLALTSGSDYALLFDSLKKEEGVPNRKKQALWTSRFMIANFLGEGISSVLGGLLGLVSISYTLFATSIAGWLPLLISLFIEEVDYKKMENSHMENFKEVLRYLFKESSFLRFLILNFVIWSLSSMLAVWTIQKNWEENKLSLLLFGLLWASYSLIGALANYLAHPLEEKIGSKKTLLFAAFCVVFAYLSIPFLDFDIVIFIMALFYISRGIFQPIFKEAFNHRLKEEFRATANSIYSMIFRLSFMVLGPLLGIYIDHHGTKSAFLITGLCFLILTLTALVPFLFMQEKESLT